MNQDLLKRYLENNCSDEERIQVEHWLEPIEIDGSEVSDIESQNLNLKERIWFNIKDEISCRESARRKIVQWTRYAVAASVLLFMTLSRANCLFFKTDSQSNALRIERIEMSHDIDLGNQRSCFYKVSNLSNTPIQLTTKSSRVYTLNQQETYLAVHLEDPGILGDPVLILSPEQIMMMPDSPLANKIAAYLNTELPKPTTNYL
ncbi:hypothetical protein [Sphingobacterium tabacisoli]|uniref:FecR protein domain-containing protein n=1 Tax=Sphingobacterium tabacisoli TaxID=2044855 RepID=A0ABW5L204_9SPHI|nr:hypothetical protein [Sphingobacterium tabacisoli]